jgi:hypothetical protein
LTDLLGRPGAGDAGEDLIASMTSSMASLCGLKPGHDLAVTGFDGTWLHSILEPSLTTVKSPWRASATLLPSAAWTNSPTGPLVSPRCIIGPVSEASTAVFPELPERPEVASTRGAVIVELGQTRVTRLAQRTRQE